MTKKTVNVVKSAAGGAAAGMLVGYLGKNIAGTSKKELKKKAEKAMDTMNDIVDTVSYMFK